MTKEQLAQEMRDCRLCYELEPICTWHAFQRGEIMKKQEKVYFKGESMWVDVISSDGKTLLGKVANLPINSAQHQYRMGDEVTAVMQHGDGWSCWEPLDAVNPSPSNNPVSRYTPDDIFDTVAPVGSLPPKKPAEV